MQYGLFCHKKYDITFYVQEVCNSIALLCQTWRDDKGRKIADTPEDLYQKFIDFSVSFTFNDTDWTLQLSPTFISALDKKLRCRINSADNFCMLGLRTLSIKSDKLKGLHEV